MICDECGAYNGHAYYCPYVNEPKLPVGANLKPVRYVAELADWLKRVNKIVERKKKEEQ